MLPNINIQVRKIIRSNTDCTYRVLQFLGAGGNSLVYLVISRSYENSGLLFALKVFTRIANLDRVRRFQQEAVFLRNCNHPAIMKIFDSGIYEAEISNKKEQLPFVIVDYLPITLFDLMRAGSISMVEKVSYALQLLSALTYLDEQKVIHRDIKPQNIFIKGKSCILGDFGLLKFLDKAENLENPEDYFQSNGPGMPVAYRTPDLVRYALDRSKIPSRSDVFQLGLVLAELFTGVNPEIRVNRNRILSEVKLRPVLSVPGALGTRIQNIINQMLIIDEKNRPRAEELLELWDGIFDEVVTRAHELNGKIF